MKTYTTKEIKTQVIIKHMPLTMAHEYLKSNSYFRSSINEPYFTTLVNIYFPLAKDYSGMYIKLKGEYIIIEYSFICPKTDRWMKIKN